jgi:hypothetical protein
MKNTLIFFVVLICLCAPAFGLTCSNDKIQASGAFMNDKITCDSITDFEVSPELAFLTVRQSVNSIHVSGNITGREVTDTFGSMVKFPLVQERLIPGIPSVFR